MKRKLRFPTNRFVCILLVSFFSQTSYSQLDVSSLEAGLTLAPSNYLGDLGGNEGEGGSFIKDNNFSMMKVMVGAHISLYPTDWLGFRLALNYGSIAGDDATIKGNGGAEEARLNRNQSFRSKISEAFIAAELYPTVFLENDASHVFHKIRPYIMAGIGAFHFNPQGQDPATGDWVILKDLHTEGQGFAEYPERKEYKLTQLNIPMGIGFKYFATENTSLSIEIIHRKTFTDYIDDVSTQYIDPDLFYKYLQPNTAILAERMYDKSGTAANRLPGEKRGGAGKDAYYSAGFKLSFRLAGSGSGDRYRKSTGCPVIRN